MRKKSFDWLSHGNWAGIAGIAAIITIIWGILTWVMPSASAFFNHPPTPVVSTPQTIIVSTPISTTNVTATPMPLATVAQTPSPTLSPASVTDWGTLTGDSITINKTLTCGDGCPDPILVKIGTIQINNPSEMIWDIHISAPTATQEHGYKDASFPQFAIQSNVTSSCPANVSSVNNSPNDFQANFPCVPINNQIYTLTVILSYHTLTEGLESIQDFPISFKSVTMSFNA
jgi:hypothetical protein